MLVRSNVFARRVSVSASLHSRATQFRRLCVIFKAPDSLNLPNICWLGDFRRIGDPARVIFHANRCLGALTVYGNRSTAKIRTKEAFESQIDSHFSGREDLKLLNKASLYLRAPHFPRHLQRMSQMFSNSINVADDGLRTICTKCATARRGHESYTPCDFRTLPHALLSFARCS